MARSERKRGIRVPSITIPFLIATSYSAIAFPLPGRFERSVSKHDWSEISYARFLQMIKFRDVVVQDQILLVLGQTLGLLLEHVLRPRPSRVAVRKVVRPHQAMDIAQVAHLECDVVVLKGGVHIFAEILAW